MGRFLTRRQDHPGRAGRRGLRATDRAAPQRWGTDKGQPAVEARPSAMVRPLGRARHCWKRCKAHTRCGHWVIDMTGTSSPLTDTAPFRYRGAAGRLHTRGPQIPVAARHRWTRRWYCGKPLPGVRCVPQAGGQCLQRAAVRCLEGPEPTHEGTDAAKTARLIMHGGKPTLTPTSVAPVRRAPHVRAGGVAPAGWAC